MCRCRPPILHHSAVHTYRSTLPPLAGKRATWNPNSQLVCRFSLQSQPSGMWSRLASPRSQTGAPLYGPNIRVAGRCRRDPVNSRGASLRLPTRFEGKMPNDGSLTIASRILPSPV